MIDIFTGSTDSPVHMVKATIIYLESVSNKDRTLPRGREKDRDTERKTEGGRDGGSERRREKEREGGTRVTETNRQR